MGDTVSLAKDKQVAVRGFSVVCDDCGAVFYISHEIISGRECKKRCSRYIEIHSYAIKYRRKVMSLAL